MGREVRKVPKDWFTRRSGGMAECAISRCITSRLHQQWKSGTRAGKRTSLKTMTDAVLGVWSGGPPYPAYHRPDWPEEDHGRT